MQISATDTLFCDGRSQAATSHAKWAPAHELDGAAAPFKATFPKTLFALPPIAVIAPMQTTTMRASMTAYSTAVGPSSAARNRFTRPSQLTIGIPLSRFLKHGQRPAPSRSLHISNEGESVSSGNMNRQEVNPAVHLPSTHPFGNLAIAGIQPSTHGFASPSCDGLAFSRMKR